MSIRFCTAFLMIWLNLASLVVAEEKKLVFSTIEGSPLAEIAGAVMGKAYDQLGIPIEIYFTSGNRALVVSSGGHVDGELVRIGVVKERFPALQQVPVPNLEAKGFVYVRRGDKERLSDSNLAKLRIGYLEGVVQAQKFTIGFENVWQAQSVDELFQLLSSGKLDAVVSDRFDGPLTIAKLGLADIVPLGAPFQVEPMFHYIHEKNSHLVPKVAKVLMQMRNSGEIDAITEAEMAGMIAEYRNVAAK
ncbi:substrate-binding periplasmic protein [Roseibium sp.]|uniref:substrate-binding periplasmic protein n=1 Tax=Roseibium sp. TaxID=1936156 RepID=UPI003B5250D3